MLICDDGSQNPPWNIGNSGTVIRYNISVNDGLHTFNITGPCQNTQIYNNVFYLGKGQAIPLVASGNWGGGDKWPADTRFTNNVFYVDGKAHFDFGGMTQVVFDHNAYWGAIASLPTDPHANMTDPQLAAPGSSGVRGYALRPVRPCAASARSSPTTAGAISGATACHPTGRSASAQARTRQGKFPRLNSERDGNSFSLKPPRSMLG